MTTQRSDHPRWCARDYCTAGYPDGEHTSAHVELTKDLDARVAQRASDAKPRLVLMHEGGHETSISWPAVRELVQLVNAAN